MHCFECRIQQHNLGGESLSAFDYHSIQDAANDVEFMQ
jgi:hypothetical protein